MFLLHSGDPNFLKTHEAISNPNSLRSILSFAAHGYQAGLAQDSEWDPYKQIRQSDQMKEGLYYLQFRPFMCHDAWFEGFYRGLDANTKLVKSWNGTYQILRDRLIHGEEEPIPKRYARFLKELETVAR